MGTIGSSVGLFILLSVSGYPQFPVTAGAKGCGGMHLFGLSYIGGLCWKQASADSSAMVSVLLWCVPSSCYPVMGASQEICEQWLWGRAVEMLPDGPGTLC